MKGKLKDLKKFYLCSKFVTNFRKKKRKLFCYYTKNKEFWLILKISFQIKKEFGKKFGFPTMVNNQNSAKYQKQEPPTLRIMVIKLSILNALIDHNGIEEMLLGPR